MAISLDISRFPLVVTTVTGTITGDELEPYLDDFMTRAVRHGEAFVSIVDARRIDAMPSAPVRSRIARWQAEHTSEGRRRNRGIVIVTDSTIVRAAMTAVNWLYRPTVATVYVATLDAAELWARQRLAG